MAESDALKGRLQSGHHQLVSPSFCGIKRLAVLLLVSLDCLS